MDWGLGSGRGWDPGTFVYGKGRPDSTKATKGSPPPVDSQKALPTSGPAHLWPRPCCIIVPPSLLALYVNIRNAPILETTGSLGTLGPNFPEKLSTPAVSTPSSFHWLFNTHTQDTCPQRATEIGLGKDSHVAKSNGVSLHSPGLISQQREMAPDGPSRSPEPGRAF